MSKASYDDLLSSIPFYQSHGCMTPFVGENYESSKHKKLLLIGESHYMPEGSIVHQNRYFEKMTIRDIATSDIEQEISLAESGLAGLQKTLNSREALLGIILEQLESLANPPKTRKKA